MEYNMKLKTFKFEFTTEKGSNEVTPGYIDKKVNEFTSEVFKTGGQVLDINITGNSTSSLFVIVKFVEGGN